MKRLLAVIGLITVLVGAGWALQTWKAMQVNARTEKFNDDVDNLFYALQQYKEHMGCYPSGNNADVAKSLNGNNARSLIILVGRKQNINNKGEFIDPWGTPLRIYFSGDGVLVRSAGPNKRFDDSTVPNSDDYYRSN
jgi:hypothetical protein